jgi:hypothetical protein
MSILQVSQELDKLMNLYATDPNPQIKVAIEEKRQELYRLLEGG